MELLTATKAGTAVRLTIDRDKYRVHQVYACLVAPDGAAGERYLCHGWGVRKAPDGMVEGILVQGRIIEVPKRDWLEIAAVRDDLRDQENLADIHLIKVYSRGEQLTIDGYTLSARVDRETWRRIAPFMDFVDSSVNDDLYDGDRFVGWVVKPGLEEEVEKLLTVKPENSIRLSTAFGGQEGAE
jgi:hypothetical protein